VTWSTNIVAVQEEGIIDNALFITKRDFKEALDVLYPIEAALSPDDPQYLEDFQEHSLGQIFRLQFPCFAIGPNRTASALADAGDRLKEAVRFDIYMGVIADSADNVTRKIMRYVGTEDLVLRAAQKSDWKRNMSVQTFGIVLEMEHVYGPIRGEASTYFRDALLQVTLTLNER
jgi:hypothetical protein